MLVPFEPGAGVVFGEILAGEIFEVVPGDVNDGGVIIIEGRDKGAEGFGVAAVAEGLGGIDADLAIDVIFDVGDEGIDGGVGEGGLEAPGGVASDGGVIVIEAAEEEFDGGGIAGRAEGAAGLAADHGAGVSGEDFVDVHVGFFVAPFLGLEVGDGVASFVGTGDVKEVGGGFDGGFGFAGVHHAGDEFIEVTGGGDVAGVAGREEKKAAEDGGKTQVPCE